MRKKAISSLVIAAGVAAAAFLGGAIGAPQMPSADAPACIPSRLLAAGPYSGFSVEVEHDIATKNYRPASLTLNGDGTASGTILGLDQLNGTYSIASSVITVRLGVSSEGATLTLNTQVCGAGGGEIRFLSGHVTSTQITTDNNTLVLNRN